MTLLPFRAATNPPPSRIVRCTSCNRNMPRPLTGVCPRICVACQFLANLASINTIRRTRSRNHAGVQTRPSPAHDTRPAGATPAPRSTYEAETGRVYGWLVSALLSTAIAVVWLALGVLR